jgi:cobalt-zinc-cadmium efflux system outer membrane protein
MIFPLLVGAVLAMTAGCVTYRMETRPLAADKSAAAYDARSLAGEDLHRFLAENLSREISPWPLAVWDFDTLSWVAFYYNSSLEVARAQWEVARAGMKTATARPNSTLTVTPGYDSSTRGGVSPWFPAINFDFLLEAGHKRDLRREIAQLNAESARQAVFTTAWQVRSELRQALLDFALAGRRGVALQAQADSQQRVLLLLQQRLAAGAVSAGEVSTARLGLVRAETAAAEAQRQVPLARQHVAQVLGVPGTALNGLQLLAPVTAEVLSTGQLAAARRQSLQTRADVLGALARYEASQAELALEVAKQNPDLHLGPGYQWDLGENKWSLALSFELPLFNRHEGPLAEAEARRREAAAQFNALQARAIVEIDLAAAAQSAAQAQVASLRRLQEEMEQQQTRVEARMKAGGADQLEVQSARLEIAAAGIALAEARAQADLAAGRLEDALQVPFANLVALEQPGFALPSPSSP